MKRRARVGLEFRRGDQAHVYGHSEATLQAVVLGIERTDQRQPRFAAYAIRKVCILRHVETRNIGDLPPALEPKWKRIIGTLTTKQFVLTQRRRNLVAIGQFESRFRNATCVERYVVGSELDLL